MSGDLLQTKLYVPRLRSSLIPRPHLIDKLNQGLQTGRKLTLISAPAGFGKTTLVTEWGQQLAQAGDWQLGWLSLDENDNALERFFTYFVAALQQINGRLGQSALELLQASPTDNLQFILTDLLNSLAQTSPAIILVLDDYFHIINPAIHEGIQFLLDYAPPRFHLLFLSRTDPPLSLARLRARGQMTEIRQDDLRLAPTEVHQFLNQLMALDLPETAVTALGKRTEGWIAGLQMAAISLQGRTDTDRFISDFSGSHRYIFDYLTEEVLAGQPAEIRDFLLQTAVLDRLCAPLCDALLAAGDLRLETSSEAAQSPIANPQSLSSQQALEHLEVANLFLMPLDDARHWYRYHQLFADLLRQQLRRERPELESVLHRRASHWFEQAGFTDEAVQHALAAADYERAADLVTQHSQSLLQFGETNKLLSWINRLPAEWQRRHPQLIFNHAWALLFNSSAKEMEAALAHMPERVAKTLPYSAYLLILRCIAATRQGQADEAIVLAEKAEAQFAVLAPDPINLSMRGVGALVLAIQYRARDGQRAGQFYDRAVSLSRDAGNLIAFLTAVRDKGRFLLEQGQLHPAEAVFRDGIQSEQQWAKKMGGPIRKLLAAAPIHASLAQLLYEWNRLDEAEDHLVDALRFLPLVGPVNHSQGLTTLARLRLAQGNASAVTPILEQLETLQAESSNQYTRLWLAIAIAETTCVLYQQVPTPALQLRLEQSLSALANEPLGGEPLAVLAQGRVLLALTRPAEALPLSETLAEQMEKNGLHGLWLSAILLRCLAHQQLGEPDKALNGLQQALSVAEPSGYTRLFLDWGQPMAELLHTAVQHNIMSDYAINLLDHLRLTILDTSASLSTGLRFEDTPNRQSQIANRQSLSPRETEVLQLIAQGLTNKEIAQRLVIAPSTAKRHTVNIYNKLGVSNRVEATAKAYELGLVNLA